MDLVVLSTKVPRDTAATLRAVAVAEDRSVSAVVRRAIQDSLREREDTNEGDDK